MELKNPLLKIPKKAKIKCLGEADLDLVKKRRITKRRRTRNTSMIRKRRSIIITKIPSTGNLQEANLFHQKSSTGLHKEDQEPEAYPHPLTEKEGIIIVRGKGRIAITGIINITVTVIVIVRPKRISPKGVFNSHSLIINIFH